MIFIKPEFIYQTAEKMSGKILPKNYFTESANIFVIACEKKSQQRHEASSFFGFWNRFRQGKTKNNFSM